MQFDLVWPSHPNWQDQELNLKQALKTLVVWLTARLVVFLTHLHVTPRVWIKDDFIFSPDTSLHLLKYLLCRSNNRLTLYKIYFKIPEGNIRRAISSASFSQTPGSVQITLGSITIQPQRLHSYWLVVILTLRPTLRTCSINNHKT